MSVSKTKSHWPAPNWHQPFYVWFLFYLLRLTKMLCRAEGAVLLPTYSSIFNDKCRWRVFWWNGVWQWKFPFHSETATCRTSLVSSSRKNEPSARWRIEMTHVHPYGSEFTPFKCPRRQQRHTTKLWSASVGTVTTSHLLVFTYAPILRNF